MGTYIAPFDFKKIFIDHFLGRAELFIFALVILIAFISAKMGLSNKIFLLILVISSVLFAAYLGQAVYFLVIMIVGILAFKGIAKMVS